MMIRILILFLPIALTTMLLQSCITNRGEVNRGLGINTKMNHAVVNVFYATDRENNASESLQNRFGSARGLGDIQYGIAKVSIPRNHNPGALEEASVWKFEFRENPDRHIILLGLQSMDATTYFQNIATRIKGSTKKSAFLFVHGYNVTFEDAARRTAQISYDLKFDGAPVFYSWPSSGRYEDYPKDAQDAAWSAVNLEKFLYDFAMQSEADQIYLIGHSMGTRVLTQAYSSFISKNHVLSKKFVEVILAAPDIDVGIFKRDIAPAMLKGEGKITIYASSEDLALQASKAFNGYPRLGDSGDGLALISGIESIDSTGMGVDLLNHSYAFENESVIDDMCDIIHNRLRAQKRSLIEVGPEKELKIPYWRFKKNTKPTCTP